MPNICQSVCVIAILMLFMINSLGWHLELGSVWKLTLDMCIQQLFYESIGKIHTVDNEIFYKCYAGTCSGRQAQEEQVSVHVRVFIWLFHAEPKVVWEYLQKKHKRTTRKRAQKPCRLCLHVWNLQTDSRHCAKLWFPGTWNRIFLAIVFYFHACRSLSGCVEHLSKAGGFQANTEHFLQTQERARSSTVPLVRAEWSAVLNLTAA